MKEISNKQALASAYKILSPYSDKSLWEFESNLTHLNFITKNIPKNKGIFDIGCGIGILPLALKLLGYEITGGDKYIFEPGKEFSVENIDGLKKIWNEYGLSITYHDFTKEGDGQKYDAVVSIATIEHTRIPKVFLEKIKKILNPGGYIYIATPNITHLLNRIRFLFGRSSSNNVKKFFEDGENFTGHWREYTIKELEEMFEQSGMCVVKTSNIQDKKPHFLRAKSVRDFYVSLFRFFSYFIPGSRDLNIVFGKKNDEK